MRPEVPGDGNTETDRGRGAETERHRSQRDRDPAGHGVQASDLSMGARQED